MAGMQFEYDEEGGTFYYFLLSFWGLVLIPCTYYLWPRSKKGDGDTKKKKHCNCEPCQIKRQRLKVGQPWLKAREKGVKVVLIIGWIIFIALAYKVSKIQLDHVEYDPFLELQVDRGATEGEIKKAYRKLSKIYHPDMKNTGDHKKFMRIAKAYAALTDEESKKNWEEFGNPDGPGVTRFGIALPKWIVERENSMWVLAAYGLVFMIIMPVVVGIWWYRSIKFSRDQVLLDTTRLYLYFFQKVQNMMLKKVVMVLAASFEFDKYHNAQIVERPSDNEEVPQLMKYLPNLEEKNREKPLCYVYSVKARALIHAHFQRLEVPPNSLELDRRYILEKCPYLINEMINIVSQLVATAVARSTMNHMPRLDTAENCMKVSQMLFQALEQKSSPLLQLPHIKQEMLRHFVTKKRNIKGIRDLVAMKEDERRSLLRNLTDDEYNDVMNVCATLPYVIMTIKSEVLDDDDSSITAGSIVTVTVQLKRHSMEILFEKEKGDKEIGHIEEEHKEEEAVEEDNEKNAADMQQKKTKVWEKQKKVVKKKGGKAKKKTKQAYQWKAVQTPAIAAPAKEDKPVAEQSNEIVPSKAEDDEDVSDEEAVNHSESEEEVGNEKDVESEEKTAGEEDDEDEWSKFQEESKKENVLDTKAKESHPVHSPYFPQDKQEAWWLYVADRKKHMLISAPTQICSLKDEEEVQLKFSAPYKPGIYTYHVILRSDCYLDFDQMHSIKLDVKEARVIEDHPQWDISDEEEDADKGDEGSDDSDYSTDPDDSEED